MPRFFIRQDQIDGETITLTGDDAHHVSRSLRMAVGEALTVCDDAGIEYACVLTEFLSDRVTARILSRAKGKTEPPYFVTVYQALPKGEKIDAVIQKAVECGAGAIAVFESERCIARIKPGKEGDKTERWQKIALEAAKQSGRSAVPRVRSAAIFSSAVSEAAKADLALFCYEGEGVTPLPAVLKRFPPKEGMTVSVMIGSEGGFSPAEYEIAVSAGMVPTGLGRRILRTETASSFVLACLSYEWEL